MVKTAVIVCTKDRASDLERCLNSLRSQEFPPAELVVVDSSRTDDTRRLVDHFRMASGIQLEYKHCEPGLTKQRNLGLRLLKTMPEVVCFLDDDVELAPGYLVEVSRRFEADRELLGVCGNVVNERKKGIFDRIIRRLFFISDYSNGKMLPSGDAGHIHAPLRDHAVAVLAGCNMCYRREVFHRHGLTFDERLSHYGYMEDQDFSYRVSRHGRMEQLANARLVHHVSPASRPGQKDLFENYIINSFYIFRKNHSADGCAYIWYGLRLLGKLLHAFQLTLKFRSALPLKGWICGFSRIRSLVDRCEQ